MLAFNQIGNLGRLGNQMFEYAAVRGIAAKHGYEWCIPPFNKTGIENYSLHQCFKLESVEEDNLNYLDHYQYMQERFFHFDEELFSLCPDHVSLQGYFQSEKYFKHIENEIREDFTFKKEVFDPCKEMVSSVDNPIALHVRRTDYVANSTNHPLCTLNYYKAALKNFNDERNVIVFSDDPEWCHQQQLFSDDRFIISENTDNRVDLCLMSLCKDFIIANSSFSWWAAWLGNRGKVIAPQKWFPDDKNTNDLYCETWEVI